MILDVDIGNTALKWRLAGSEQRGRAPLAELIALTELKGISVKRVRVSCVAGSQTEQRFAEWCRENVGTAPEFARVIDGRAGLQVGYGRPQTLGVDRWLAMLAGWQRLRTAFVVVDAGSALTADFVDSAGVHHGGLILPGVQLMAEALFRNTDAVKVNTLTLPQKWQPGRDTLSCVENGVAAAVRGLVSEITAFGENTIGNRLAYLVCGGDAEAIARHLPGAELCPELVMDGLQVALGDC